MMNGDQEPGAAGSAPRLRPLLRAAVLVCPRCGHGRLFERFFSRELFRMRPACDHCGLAYTREPGFYLGSIYINYGATVLLTGGLYAVLVMLAGWSSDAAVTACLAVAVAFPILFFRHARSFLLALDATVNRQQSQPDGGGDTGSLTADQLASLTSDDARAGCLMGLVLVLIMLFGLGMAAATLFFMQPTGDREASSEAVDLR